MTYTGTQILAWIAVIANIANMLVQIPDPNVSLVGKVAVAVLAGLSALVAALVQFGLIPALRRLED